MSENLIATAAYADRTPSKAQSVRLTYGHVLLGLGVTSGLFWAGVIAAIRAVKGI